MEEAPNSEQLEMLDAVMRKLIVDTGQREWSARTKRFETVWASQISDKRG
jgi:hypothetical protein